MGFSAIIPVDQVIAANAALEAQGFGPNNFSVPLLAAPDGVDLTHLGLNCAADSEALKQAIEAIPGVSIQDAPAGEVHFDSHVEGQGLMQIPSDEPVGGDDEV
jgi:hypothetical protein